MSRLIYEKFLKQTLLVLCLLAATATVIQAGISGSKHDFSGKGWGTNEICIFCHTPHNAKTVTGYNTGSAPLWNHMVTSATYTLYSSSTLKQTPLQPRGPSKLCLSCHDGTVAIDSLGNQNGTHFATGTANLGTNLSDDHPISIYWNHQTGQTTCGNCHSLHPSGYIGLPFYSRYLECATCHEPHNRGPEIKMLRKALVGSAICLHCHGK
jgi:predicted CXXCH cytochrome family protein